MHMTRFIEEKSFYEFINDYMRNILGIVISPITRLTVTVNHSMDSENLLCSMGVSE